MRRGVGDVQFHGQFIGNGDDEFRVRGLSSPRALGTSGRRRRGNGAVRRGGGLDEFPRGRSGRSRGRIAIASAEPGETDGHAAADGFVRREQAAAAQEEQRVVAFFLEAGDVRAMQIDFRGGGFGGGDDLGQAAVAGGQGDAPGISWV